jgi:hypothetical protein
MHYSLRRLAFGWPVLDRNASNTLQMMAQNFFLRAFFFQRIFRTASTGWLTRHEGSIRVWNWGPQFTMTMLGNRMPQ